MGYSSGQRFAFAGLLIGFLMCATGNIAPYWQEGDISVNKLASIVGESLPVIGDMSVASMHGGLWWYCWEVLGQGECSAYDFQDDTANYSWAIRIISSLNVVLTLICSLTALCRACCCTGGKTICHGILAFIAGAAGVTAIGVFAGEASEGFGMKMKLMTFGWAFYVYIAGTAVVMIVSFMLCFASPDNPLTPIIIHSVGNVLPGGRYVRMADDRVPLEETGGDTHVNVNYPHVQSY